MQTRSYNTPAQMLESEITLSAEQLAWALNVRVERLSHARERAPLEAKGFPPPTGINTRNNQPTWATVAIVAWLNAQAATGVRHSACKTGRPIAPAAHPAVTGVNYQQQAAERAKALAARKDL
jgi:hypothetical protein